MLLSHDPYTKVPLYERMRKSLRREMLEKVKPSEDILINDVGQINNKSDLSRIIRHVVLS